jgi:hypothetical protein
MRSALRRVRNVARRSWFRLRDACSTSYGDQADGAGQISRLIPAGTRVPLTAASRCAVEYFASHRFDLLGSGWVRVGHGMRCRGFEGIAFDPARIDTTQLDLRINARNRDLARAVRTQLPASYSPIDWHLDFKSGYRWSERTGYRDIRYGHIAGVDVKVPWELSRMQHLPELAAAFTTSQDGALPAEFECQVRDWIAQNPPRFGVNWACTMDVGIRIANWLIAFDLFRAGGAQFDASFERLFARSVAEHAAHIAGNLEWSETRRANHYLGNIAGLLFAAMYLTPGARSDTWLLFAALELDVEAARQFLDDGGHFEASTSYHRLCAEMLAVCAVFLSRVPEQRIAGAFSAVHAGGIPSGPGFSVAAVRDVRSRYERNGALLGPHFHERLARAAEMTRNLTRRDGSVPQIGDDDSGRFLRLSGWVDAGTVAQCRARYRNLEGYTELPDDAAYPLQSRANHQQWLAWASAALGRDDLLDGNHAEAWSAAAALASAVARPVALKRSLPAPTAQVSNAPEADAVAAPPQRLSSTLRAEGGDLFANARYDSHPQFGIYIVRSDRVHLVIRCGYALHDCAGVHAHDDQLAFDLVLDGRPVAVDPGTYIYTPSGEWRNRYRSARAHCAPSLAGPSSGPARTIFSAPLVTCGRCSRFDADAFVGNVTTAAGSVQRTIRFLADRLEIHDEYRLHPGWRPASADLFAPAEPLPFSPGYGVQQLQ